MCQFRSYLKCTRNAKENYLGLNILLLGRSVPVFPLLWRAESFYHPRMITPTVNYSAEWLFKAVLSFLPLQFYLYYYFFSSPSTCLPSREPAELQPRTSGGRCTMSPPCSTVGPCSHRWVLPCSLPGAGTLKHLRVDLQVTSTVILFAFCKIEKKIIYF